MSVKKELEINGYAFRDSNVIASELSLKQDDVAKFCMEWGELGADNYLQGDYMFRYRRYGQIGFIPETGSMWKRDDVEYFQSEEINTYAGGLSRKFFPLTESIVGSVVFRRLVLGSFEKFGVEPEHLNREWYGDIHLFRLVVVDDKDTNPTPEGIHRDGFPFGALHLMSRHNIEGAVSRVYSLDEDFLTAKTLSNPLDTFYCVDRKVKHYTTPFYSTNSDFGYRDVLVYGFHLPESKYEKA